MQEVYESGSSVTADNFGSSTQSLRSWIASLRTKIAQSRPRNLYVSHNRCNGRIELQKTSRLARDDTENLSLALQSIFPSLDSNPDVRRCGMQWYPRWIEAQLEGLSIPALPLVDDNPQGGVSPQFWIAFSAMAKVVQSSKNPSIDSIVDSLVAQGIINEAGTDNLSEARSLVFAILGWQTMLFKPALGTCPPQQLAVTDEQEGYRGQAIMALKQSHTGAKRPLNEFLMGFGILLPPPNFCMTTSPEEQNGFDDLRSVEPASFNAFLFDSIGHFKIKWVGIVSCHLEFDERTKVLYLYRYPSFCLACGAEESLEKHIGSVIHAAASPDPSRQWAERSDVTSMLHETLLSYRLLFGQSKQARRFYKTIDPFAADPEASKDHLLSALCGRRSCSVRMTQDDKSSYDLQQDFPILRSRITKLHKALSASKPRSWRELWTDKRDSSGWLTFWAVIVFGGVAVLLAFVQVLLQIVQIALSR